MYKNVHPNLALMLLFERTHISGMRERSICTFTTIKEKGKVTVINRFERESLLKAKRKISRPALATG